MRIHKFSSLMSLGVDIFFVNDIGYLVDICKFVFYEEEHFIKNNRYGRI